MKLTWCERQASEGNVAVSSCWLLLRLMELKSGGEKGSRSKVCFKVFNRVTDSLTVNVTSRKASAEAGFQTWLTKRCAEEFILAIKKVIMPKENCFRDYQRKKKCVFLLLSSSSFPPRAQCPYRESLKLILTTVGVSLFSRSKRQLLIGASFQSHFLYGSLSFVFLFDVLLFYK